MLIKSTHSGKTMKIQSVWRPVSSRSSAQTKPRYAIQRAVKPVRTPIIEVEIINTAAILTA